MTESNTASKLNPIQKFLSNRIVIFGVAIVISLIAISQSYFPFSGFAIAGLILLAYSFFGKVSRTKTDYIFAAVGGVSALSFGIFSSPLVLFLSGFLYIYSCAWLTTKAQDFSKGIQFLHLLFPFVMRFSMVWNTLDTLPKIKDLFQKELTEDSKPSIIQKFFGHSNSLVWNLLITSVVLIIILPLLSYSNPYFASFISGFFESTVRWILEFFNWTIICRVLIFFYFLAYLPRLLCYYQKDVPENREFREFTIPIPKLTIILALSGFLVAQLQVYLNPQLLGLTAGNQAREIFFHLSAVCLVVFLLLYINLKKNLLAKITSILLLIQSVFLVGIAFNSDWNYVNSWGLTHLRLYGFSLIALIFGFVLVFGASMIPVFKNISKNIGLTQLLALVFCFVLVITNVMNFDAMIYKNPPRETQGVAYSYIARMSLDSMSLAREYQRELSYELAPKKATGRCSDRDHYNETTVEYLQGKYSKFQFVSYIANPLPI